MKMGPKKEKKKGKKKEEKLPKTTKTQYLNKIAENNAILAQARKKIAEIEHIYFNAEKNYEQTQEDTADIIKYLQHEIEENEEEIATYDERIISLKAETAKNDKYYESIFSKLENEYEEKNMQLQQQIQLTNAKLFASEEIRKQRDEYLKLKETFRQKLQQMKCRHEEEIYTAEKLAITKQDTLQKNMETHLTTLATDFRQATDIAIGETTNKLIKDNITLGNTLTCTQEIIQQSRNLYLRALAVEKKFRYNAELLNDEHCFIVKKYESQIQKIETLLKSHEEITERIVASQRLFKGNRRLQRDIAEKECILKERTQELNDLLRILEENEETSNLVKTAFNAIRKTILKLELLLFEGAKKVKEGIDVENLTRLEDKDEDLHMEIDKEEQEENLKEFKYKTRKIVIEDIVEKLSSALLYDPEMQLVAPSSDSYLASFHESISSEVGANRSFDFYGKKNPALIEKPL